ncbi:hypothetical protein LJR255_001923 [Pararhizobium sp. LjRoot255]|uniref:hypothetical protein n=1 Tax=Pararhizobium sp. LjRoot255 TaxID=3342298 RepID=UPI003ECC3E5B
MNELKDPACFARRGHRRRMARRGAAAGRTIEVIDPTTQGVLGTVPDAPADLSGGKSSGQFRPG